MKNISMNILFAAAVGLAACGYTYAMPAVNMPAPVFGPGAAGGYAGRLAAQADTISAAAVSGDTDAAEQALEELFSGKGGTSGAAPVVIAAPRAAAPAGRGASFEKSALEDAGGGAAMSSVPAASAPAPVDAAAAPAHAAASGGAAAAGATDAAEPSPWIDIILLGLCVLVLLIVL